MPRIRLWHGTCNIISETNKTKDMNAKDEISALFNGFSKDEQVEILTELYYRMTDYQKDEFLHETEND